MTPHLSSIQGEEEEGDLRGLEGQQRVLARAWAVDEIRSLVSTTAEATGLPSGARRPGRKTGTLGAFLARPRQGMVTDLLH